MLPSPVSYCDSVFSWSPSLDAAKQAELGRRIYKPPRDLFFSHLSRQALVSGKPTVSNPARSCHAQPCTSSFPKVQLSDHAKMTHAAPRVVSARTTCLENCVCTTLLGERKRNYSTAEPGHKYPLKGPVMALPSTVVLYIHISINTYK